MKVASANPLRRNGTREAALAAALSLVCVVFWDALQFIVRSWEQPEYSHGYVIPLISLAIIWSRRLAWQNTPGRSSWVGVLLLFAMCATATVGALATVHGVTRFALVGAVAGTVLTIYGWPRLRLVLAPILYLLFAIPIPLFLYYRLSANLQLLSSEFGVAFIRLLGISVHLEGNVIDLGEMKLQVVEACSGLRYLFPLLSVTTLIAWWTRAPRWIRVVVVLSAIPTTVVLNSLRIGLTGLLVEYFGIRAAQGFFHDFEGWVIFMAGIGLTLILLWALRKSAGIKGQILDNRIGDVSSSFKSVEPQSSLSMTRTIGAGIIALLLGAGLAISPSKADDYVPPRASFASFPLTIGGWSGRREALETEFLDALQLDDYLLADYWAEADRTSPVNLYVAYYASQKDGSSNHSPKGCLPGAGWEISEFGVKRLDLGDGPGFPANRAVMSKGGQRLLVYYWFDERGRKLSNEYLVKAYILWDAIFKKQTYGALVRVALPMAVGESAESADQRALEFMSAVAPKLRGYIPD